MAKYGKNNYFDGVVLPEPKEEMLRRMAKGVNCSDGGFMSAAAELKVVPCSIQCVFKPMVLTDSPQTVFAMSGGASAPRIDLHNGYITAYLGYNSIRIYDIAVDTVYDFVFVCDSDKSILYVNGNLAASFADVSRCSGYKLGYLLVNSTKYHFQGDYLLHRHFNYAMSANEVKAIDNTGDPAGYVLPGALKLTSDVNYYKSDFSEGVDNWTITTSLGGTIEHGDNRLIVNAPTSTSRDFASMQIYRSSKSLNKQRSYFSCKVVTSEADISEITVLPWSWSGVRLKKSLQPDGKLLWTGVFFRDSGVSGIIYLNLYTKKEISYEIYDIECKQISCVAEYLPQNLIPTAEGSVVQWLDSAPQLPEANGILPPLDASVGGYDLAAIGNPKIII